MARIRSVKPDFFRSETLNKVSKLARLTFIGLWTYVDDNGVGIDNPRLITADLYPLEEDQGAELAAVTSNLMALAHIGVIRRYSIDGKNYFFVTNWDEHQKISHPAKPRYFRPEPGPGNPPGPHPSGTGRVLETVRNSSGGSPEVLGSTSEALSGTENRPGTEPRRASETDQQDPDTETGHSAGQNWFRKSSGNLPATLRPEQGAGSREKGAGKGDSASLRSAARSGPTAPMLELVPAVADQPTPPQTSGELVAYWLENVRHRPAESVIGRVGKSIKTMLADGIDPDHIAAALPLWVDRGLDPSVLPSVVNQVQNAAPASQPRQQQRPGDDLGTDAHMKRYLERAAERRAQSA